MLALALHAALANALIEQSARRAVPLLQQAATVHVKKKTCFGCHNQGPPALALAAARLRGVSPAKHFYGTQREHLVEFIVDNRAAFVAGKGTGGGVDTAGALLFALEPTGHEPDENTAAVVEYLLRDQEKRGHWACSSRRPPSEASHFATTYVAVRALLAWATPVQEARADTRVAAARAWLERTPAKDTEDRVYRLLGLALTGSGHAARQAGRDLVATQRPDGGWGQLPDLPSDAYATGTALFALSETGTFAATAAAYRRGLAFLVATQRTDGTWFVKSRSDPFQPYYESGFPHGKDQFISASASGWAALALWRACPER